MPKVKIKFKLTGLEFEVEAEREDMPVISQNLANQLGGILTPAASIASGKLPAITQTPSPADDPESSAKTRRKGVRRAGAAAATTTERTAKALDWQHNSEQWGNPLQTWTLLQKAIWLLYVAKAEGSISEMTSTQVTETFNKHFRQSGAINRANTARDLGKAKAAAPAKVGEDTTKSPSTWYLTTEGEKTAAQLVNEGRGIKAS